MRRLANLVLVAPLLALGACSEDANKVTEPNTPPLAYIRYVHAIPDTGAVIVRLTNPPVENVNGGISVAYRTVTPWSGITAGARRVTVFPQTTNVNLAQMFITDTTLNLQADTYYTFLHTGLGGRCLGHANVPAAQSVRARLYVIQEPRLTAGAEGLDLNGAFGLRVQLASPGFANPQDVYLTRDTTTAALGTPVAMIQAAPPPPTNSMTETATAAQWRKIATGALILRSYNRAAPLTVANRTLLSTVTAGGAPAASTVSAPPGSTVANTAMTAFIFGPALTGDCSQTGNVTVTYGADVRAPVPQ
jgi:hypothetical protein